MLEAVLPLSVVSGGAYRPSSAIIADWANCGGEVITVSSRWRLRKVAAQRAPRAPRALRAPPVQ
jgi:hypothetical protein